MACVWVYPPEILPLKLRAKGAALAAAADFLGNFLVSCGSFAPGIRRSINCVQVVEITPPALTNIGYRTYIIFAVFNIVIAGIVWCFYPETSGLSLEAIDSLFVVSDESLSSRKHSKLQWWVIANSRAAVKAAKARKDDHETGASDETESSEVGKASQIVAAERLP